MIYKLLNFICDFFTNEKHKRLRNCFIGIAFALTGLFIGDAAWERGGSGVLIMFVIVLCGAFGYNVSEME